MGRRDLLLSADKKIEMKSIFVFVPDELHMKFKMKIIEEKTTIKDTILSFLALYVKEEKNEKKQKNEIKKDSKKTQK